MDNSIFKGKWKQIKVRCKKCSGDPSDYNHDIADGDVQKLSGVNRLKIFKFKGARVISLRRDFTVSIEKEDQTKALNFLHNFSLLLRKEKSNLKKIMEKTVKLLPSAYEYPEELGVCICFKGQAFKTRGYETSPWKITSQLEMYGEQIGSIEVCYRKPPLNELDSFTKEEQLIIETIAEHLSRVTEQIQAKEELQISKNKLSITLDSIGDGVIVTDASEKITRLNPQAEKLTGWSEEEALGRTFQEVFHIVNGKTGEPVPNPVRNVIKTGRTQGLASETVLIARDGIKRHIADSAAPIRDNKGNIFSVIMVFSDVSERREAEESLKYQLEFEKMLAEVSNAFSVLPSDQLEHSIQNALKQIREFFQIERSYLFQFSDDGKKMNNTYEPYEVGTESQTDRVQNESAAAFSWWVEQIKNKENVNVSDVDSLPPEAEAVKKEFKSHELRSLLYIPMMQDSIVFGFIGLAGVKEKKIWTENQLMLLTIAAELVANAYMRKMEEEKVRYQSFHDGLTGLHNRIYMEDEMMRLDTDRQLPIGLIMVDSNGLKLVNDSFGHEAGDELLKSTAEILTSTCRAEDIISRWGGDEFVILLPQTTEEEVNAICQRIAERCEETYVKEIPLSMAVGYAIKNDKEQVLEEILVDAEENMYKNKLAESQSVKSRAVNSILKNLEKKSFETEAHYSVMQNAAKRIGVKMGLTQLEFNRLEKLILFHDIGEVNISKEILNKKSPLTSEEWEDIMKHPETGYRILHASDVYASVAEDAWSHHERWEGQGYPRGLKGDEIPLLARIVAVVDAYEVMRSGRPYKKAMPLEEIVLELKRCAGFQFDPEIVEIFLQCQKLDLRQTSLEPPDHALL